jgi:hypothetical protein
MSPNEPPGEGTAVVRMLRTVADRQNNSLIAGEALGLLVSAAADRDGRAV